MQPTKCYNCLHNKNKTFQKWIVILNLHAPCYTSPYLAMKAEKLITGLDFILSIMLACYESHIKTLMKIFIKYI